MADFDFAHFAQENWIDAIPAAQRGVIQGMLDAGKTEQEIAELWLNRIGPELNVGFGAGASIATYFSNFRDEIDAFVCGDPRYANERGQAAAIWEKQGRNGLVALVAGCIATNIGLAAVALVPIVALFLSLVGKMGVGAYCKTRGKV